MESVKSARVCLTTKGLQNAIGEISHVKRGFSNDRCICDNTERAQYVLAVLLRQTTASHTTNNRCVDCCLHATTKVGLQSNNATYRKHASVPSGEIQHQFHLLSTNVLIVQLQERTSAYIKNGKQIVVRYSALKKSLSQFETKFCV